MCTRWLPQRFYYFYAYQQWKDKNNPPVIAVPSGNFGNICTGLIAYRSGLPVKHFIAATNANDVVPEYFKNEKYHTENCSGYYFQCNGRRRSRSNFVRMLELFDHHFGTLKQLISSYSISDEETKQIIIEVNNKYNYLPDPHGAVAYAAIKKYLNEHRGRQSHFHGNSSPY